MGSKLLWSAWLLAVFVPVAAAQTPDRFEGRLVLADSEAPLAGASISIVGVTGTARTDADGRFTWAPVPPVPFQVIVVLSGGQVVRPVTVDALQQGTTTIRITALTDEAVTVLGAAPSVTTAPASATTVLSGTQIAQRSPENLMQALETVPGINQVSEGHASVPAVRGLARGRTLFLIDGGRVTAERRVGPERHVPRSLGHRGHRHRARPGVGRLRLGRVRRRHLGPHASRGTGQSAAGTRRPAPSARAFRRAAGRSRCRKGFAHGGVLVQAHVRNAEDYDSPEGEVFNSGWEDQGFLVHFTHAVGKGFLSTAWQSDYGRDFERPRNNSRTVRFYYPFENSHRFTTSYEVARRRRVPADCVHRIPRRLRAANRPGSLCHGDDRPQHRARGRLRQRLPREGQRRAARRAGTGRVRRRRERPLRPRGARHHPGVTIWRARSPRDTTNVSVEDARRTDTGAYVQAESALGRFARVSGGIRGDHVTTKNVGGFFGDRSTSNGAASRFRRPHRRAVPGLQRHRAGRRAASAIRCCPTAISAGRRAAASSPAIPTSSPRPALQFDLATRYTVARTQVAVYFYHYRIDDLIERYQTQPDFFFFRNRGRARLRGFEVEARSDLGQGLFDRGGDAGLTRTRARRRRLPRRHLAGHVFGARPQGLRSPRSTRRRGSHGMATTIARARAR